MTCILFVNHVTDVNTGSLYKLSYTFPPVVCYSDETKDGLVGLNLIYCR